MGDEAILVLPFLMSDKSSTSDDIAVLLPDAPIEFPHNSPNLQSYAPASRFACDDIVLYIN
jgi:hypothetical protein